MEPETTLIAEQAPLSAPAVDPTASTSYRPVQGSLPAGNAPADGPADQAGATATTPASAEVTALQDVPMSESEASGDAAEASPPPAVQGGSLVDVVMQGEVSSGGDADDYKSTADRADESDESDDVVAPGHASRVSAATASSSRGGRKGKGRLELPDEFDPDLYGLRRSVLLVLALQTLSADEGKKADPLFVPLQGRASTSRLQVSSSRATEESRVRA